MSIIMCFDAVSVVVHCHSRHRNVEWFSFSSYFIVTEEPRNSTPNAVRHHIDQHEQLYMDRPNEYLECSFVEKS